MPWPKGKPREKKTQGSGRKPGTPNKRTRELIERAEEMAIDPFDILLHVAAGDWKSLGYKKATVPAGQFGTYQVDLISLKDRMWAAAEACQYLYPKRKALEVSGKGGGPLDVYLLMTPEERARRILELEDRLARPGSRGKESK